MVKARDWQVVLVTLSVACGNAGAGGGAGAGAVAVAGAVSEAGAVSAAGGGAGALLAGGAGAVAVAGARAEGGTVGVAGARADGGADTVAGARAEGGAVAVAGARADGGTGAEGLAGSGGAPSATVPTLESARQDHTNWQRFTTEPQSISGELAGLCRIPTPAEEAFAKSEHGHELFLLNWLNEPAAEGFAHKEEAPFPTGAAIVKEKLRRTANGYELYALGFLIKHPPGYDPEFGDWEFGYWEAESGMSSGRETQLYCGSCHETSGTDFVFLDHRWRLARPPSP